MISASQNKQYEDWFVFIYTDINVSENIYHKVNWLLRISQKHYDRFSD